MPDSFNNFSQIASSLEDALRQLVRETASAGQENVQNHIKANGQVRTGRMLNSVYMSTSEGSTYQGGEKILPEIDRPDNDLEAFIAVGAEYSAYNEYGTTRMAPKPFFEPAMNETQQVFEENVQKLADKLQRGNM